MAKHVNYWPTRGIFTYYWYYKSCKNQTTVRYDQIVILIRSNWNSLKLNYPESNQLKVFFSIYCIGAKGSKLLNELMKKIDLMTKLTHCHSS